MGTLQFIAIYCHCFIAIINAESKTMEAAIMRDFGECEGMKKTPLHFNRLTVNVTGRGATTFNGYIDADEDLDHISHMEIRLEKCNSYAESSSCEFYSTYKFNDPCETIFSLKDGPWAALFNTKPSLTCPVKKGSYGLHHSSVKASYLGAMKNAFWKFSLKMLTGKRIVSCIKGGIEKAVIRIKSKSKHQ